MRFDKPIGIYLLLYPTLWALMLAGAGIREYVIFILGVIVMRSAGCVINDYADRDIDKFVERTQNRPITSGEITPKNALNLFFALMFFALFLVVFTNVLTLFLAVFAAVFATIYPFTKRFFPVPQLFLGIAFAFAVPMSFAASLNLVPLSAWVIFIATVIWTIMYDTQYAMSDRAEDLKIGVKSSAIFFGKFDRIIIATLQLIFIVLLFYIQQLFNLGFIFIFAIFVVILLFIYQQHLIKNREKNNCFQAFLNNNYIGLVLTFAILIDIFIIL